MRRPRLTRYPRRSFRKRGRGYNNWTGTKSVYRMFRIKPYLHVAYTEASPDVYQSNPKGFYWQLNGLPGYANYVADWEEYKIVKVAFRVTPIFSKGQINDTSISGNNMIQQLPLLCCNVKQQDQYNEVLDALSTKAIGDTTDYAFRLRNYYLCKSFDGNRSFTWSCKPKIGFSAYETTINTAYVAKRSWVSTTDPATIHSGTIITADAYQQGWTPTDFPPSWRIDQAIYVKFRKPTCDINPT